MFGSTTSFRQWSAQIGVLSHSGRSPLAVPTYLRHSSELCPVRPGMSALLPASVEKSRS
jgi:hypothetical protein